MNRILITGGTGFLGKQLVRRLVERGDTLIMLTRQPQENSEQIHYVQSLDDIPATTIIDACINLAGEPLFNFPWTANKRKRIWDSRINTTTALTHLNRRLDQPIATLLSGSASGYYGDKGNLAVNETADPGQHYGAELCHRWESCALENSQLNTRVCLLRTGIVIGKGGALQPMLPTFKFGLGASIGSGEQFWPWIAIEDWVSATLFCLDHKTMTGPVNMCAPHAVTNKAFTQLLAQVLHRVQWLPGIPSGLLRVITGHSSDLLTDSVNMVPKALQDAGFSWAIADCREALAIAVAAADQ